MHNLYELVCSGKGQIMLVGGAEGCGKSSLIKHFAKKASEIKKCRTLSFQCRGASIVDSYTLLYRLILGNKCDENQRVFFETAEPSAIADYFYDILNKLSDNTPLIIIADDLQYCNPDIYSMFYALVRRIVYTPCSIMAVAAYNMADIAVADDPLINRIRRDLFPITIGSITAAWKSGGLCELIPEPLKLSDTSDLLSAMFPQNNFPSDSANIIHSITQGNPAYMVGLLNYMQSNGDIKLENDEYTIDNLSFYFSARHLQSVITQPTKHYKYRYHNNKISSDAKPNELLDKAIEAVYKPSMIEAIEYADATINALKKYRDTDAVFEYRATALQAKHMALSWLGYFHEALECAQHLVTIANQHPKLGYYKAAGLYFIGCEYFNLSEYAEALKYLEAAMNMVKSNPKHPAIPECEHALGKVYLIRNQYTTATNYFESAIKHYQDLGNNEKATLVKVDMAALKRTNKDNASAYALSNEAVAFFTKERKTHLLAKAYINLGLSYDTDGRYAEAKHYYMEALRLCFATGDRPNIANCYNDMGLSKNSQSKYAEALVYFNKALEIDRMLGNNDKISISYNNIGIALMNSGDEKGAEKYFENALEIDNRSTHKQGIAFTYSNLGSLYAQKSQTDIALRYYKLALKADTDNNDVGGMISDYNAIGNIYYGDENIQEAMEYFNKSLELSKESDDVNARAAAYNNIGNIFFSRQDYDQAAQYYSDALSINSDIKDNAAAGLNCSNLASVYEEQKNLARAETYYDRAIEFYHKAKLKIQEAYNLNNLAMLYYRNEKYNKAKITYLAAANIYQNTSDVKEYIRSLTFAGDTMRMLCEYKEAEKTLNKAVELAQNSGDLHAEAFATGTLACMYNEKPDSSLAIEYYQKSIDLYRKDDDLEQYAEMLSSLAFVYSDAGDTNEALICQHQAADTFRQLGNIEKLATAYSEIAMLYEDGNYEKAADNYLLSADYYSQIESFENQAEALCHAAAALTHTEKRSAALQYLVSAAQILSKLFQQSGNENNEGIIGKMVQVYTAMADFYFENKDYITAIENYTVALDISKRTEGHTRTAYLCNNIGYTYDTIGYYVRALDYYTKACEYYDKEEFKNEGLFNNLKNVALMCERLGKTSEAAENFRKAFDTFEKEFFIDISALASCALQAANAIFNSNGDFDTASIYYQKAYHLYKKDDNQKGMIAALHDRAVAHAIAKQSDESSSVARQIMHVFDIATDVETKCAALRATAQVHIKNGNLNEAVKIYQQELDILFARDLWSNAAQLYYDMAAKFAENCGKMAATIDFNGKTLTMYNFISKLMSNAAELAKTEKDSDLEIQVLISQARYNVQCDEKSLALQYLSQAVAAAAATGSPITEATTLLEMADMLMRYYQEFENAGQCINRALITLEPLGKFQSNLSFAYTLKFVQLVFTKSYDEANKLYHYYSPLFEGHLEDIPLLRQALRDFYKHFSAK